MNQIAAAWQREAVIARSQSLQTFDPAPFNLYLHHDAQPALERHLQSLRVGRCRIEITDSIFTTLGFVPVSDAEFKWNVRLTEHVRNLCDGSMEISSPSAGHTVQMYIHFILQDGRWVVGEPRAAPYLFGEMQ